MPDSVHQVLVDHSESRSVLLAAMRRSGAFEIGMVNLTTGDYLIDNEVLIERKSAADFAATLQRPCLTAVCSRRWHGSLTAPTDRFS